MKYYILTFGCQMNKSDSERIEGLLEKTGFRSTCKIEEANLIVVNMCSVRQSAVDRIFGLAKTIIKLKRKNPSLQTIITGCILEQDKQKLKKFFDFILNIKDLPNWPYYLKINSQLKVKNVFKNKKNYFSVTPKYKSKITAFVPISNGCNNFCSYCVVPYTRGKLICRPAQEILKEIKDLVKKGYKEIWLLGQNVNDYTSKLKTKKIKKIDFSDLLKMIEKIPGDFKFFFTSPHPKNFSEKLIKTLARSKKFGKYLNLPIQSGDDKILKKMNRNYTVAQYKKLIKKIRKEIPDIVLSTDIIVGFPGETKKHFQNTVKLLKEIKYDMAYISQYSPRSATKAFYQYKDDVPKKEKKEREKILTKVLKKTALEKNKKWVGKITTVLIEKKQKNCWVGKNDQYKTVKVINNPLQLKNNETKLKELAGKIVKVKIIKAYEWALEGQLL